LVNIILVQEEIHLSKEAFESRMAIKLDMGNTFDWVRHSFLFLMLKKIGFFKNFIRWIKSCIRSPWRDSLVNVQPAPFFVSSRGLRQGYPLSPLLYTIMAESLSRNLENARQ